MSIETLKTKLIMLKKYGFIVFVFSIFLIACSTESEDDLIKGNGSYETPTLLNKSPGTFQFTSHFDNWLQQNGYGSYNFKGSIGYSYGGKTSSSETLNNQPIIFIHGNSDKAEGWGEPINYFLNNGYNTSELYAFTWGNANPYNASSNYHSKEFLQRIRVFIQTVKNYTGAQKVDVIGHSMGVTLGRKAIKGGNAYDQAYGYYNLGTPLNYVDTFVGIAGANRGLTSCYYSGTGVPTCNDVNGFYPGYLFWGAGPYGVSNFLTELNNNPTKEANKVYSIWSSADQVVGYGCIVYGENTCRINTQDGEKYYSSAPYGHFGVKNLSGYYQLQMVKYHSTY